jgi:hypothetical protein
MLLTWPAYPQISTDKAGPRLSKNNQHQSRPLTSSRQDGLLFMQCKATMGAHDVNENNFPYAADHIIGRPDKTFMECHAIKWTLLNQVTGKSEAKQSMNHQCD